MSTTVLIPAGLAAQVSSTSSVKSFGSRASLFMSTAGTSPTFWWFSLAGIPAGAIVSNAYLQPVQFGAFPALSRTLTARPVVAWAPGSLTFNRQPAFVGAASAPATLAGAQPADTRWSIPVTAIVQAMLLGPVSERGYFRIVSSDATRRTFRGAGAGTGAVELRSLLVVEYTLPGDPPEHLVPAGGAVGSRTPQLSWLATAGETSRRVQVATTEAGFGAPAYDSGLVAGPAGLFDLAGTAYQLPADSSVNFWRVQRTVDGTLSDWSDPVDLWFRALPVVTTTSPGATTPDDTPPTVWSVAGGLPPYVSWSATYRRGTAVLEEVVGGDAGLSATPSQRARLKALGDQVAVEVRVTDSEVRAAGPGSPVYGAASQTYQLSTAAVPPVANLAVAVDRIAPWATLTWSHGSVPDAWAVFRDGVLVGRVLGPAALDGGPGNHATWVDRTATANLPHQWSVAPVTNGAIGTPSNLITATPRIIGLWVFDQDSGEAVQLVGKDEVDADRPSIVATSTPLGFGYDAVRVVSQSAGTFPFSGMIAGAYGRDPRVQWSLLDLFRREGPGLRNLRFAYVTVNAPAVLHSVVDRPVRAGAAPGSLRWMITGTAVAQPEPPVLT